jgi:RNA 2',3'-cyclic 3'-phosphodiesterase
VRLFIAIETGPDIAAAARALLGELRRRVRDAAPGARVTWIPPERLHLTVRFIGEVDEPRLRAIDEALTPPLRTAAFDLGVKGVGVFPRKGPPRVIWAGVHAGREAAIAVEREIAARVDLIAGPGEDRAFSPHLTLARIRHAAGLDRRVFDDLEQVVVATTRVDAVTLFESRLSPHGPTYEPLRRTPLRT